MKKILLILILLFSFILPVFADEEFNMETILPSETGRIISVETFGDYSPSTENELQQIKQSAEVEILTGIHQGEKIFIENILMGNPFYDIYLNPNDMVILHAEKIENGINYFIADKYRVHVLYILSVIFFLLVIIVGKKKGFFSLISILITLSLIFWGLTPLILKGVNPVLATVMLCVLSSIITIYLVGGLNSKSSAAILGTVLSLIIAGILSILSIDYASLTGFTSEESLFLFSAHPELNFHGVLASAMIIGALGAVMDIGMSISSTINEIYISNPDLGFRKLCNSGMNVGKDIIGTMANTLILAYLGSALSLLLLSNNIDLQKFFNLNLVATEIISALIGSIGIVLCVPITAVIAAGLIKRLPPKRVEENDFDGIIS